MEGIKLKKKFSAGFVAKLCLADLERGRLGAVPRVWFTLWMVACIWVGR